MSWANPEWTSSWIKGASIYDVRRGGTRDAANFRTKRVEGVKKSPRNSDVIYGSPLSRPMSPSVIVHVILRMSPLPFCSGESLVFSPSPSLPSFRGMRRKHVFQVLEENSPSRYILWGVHSVMTFCISFDMFHGPLGWYCSYCAAQSVSRTSKRKQYKTSQMSGRRTV